MKNFTEKVGKETKGKYTGKQIAVAVIAASFVTLYLVKKGGAGGATEAALKTAFKSGYLEACNDIGELMQQIADSVN